MTKSLIISAIIPPHEGIAHGLLEDCVYLYARSVVNDDYDDLYGQLASAVINHMDLVDHNKVMERVEEFLANFDELNNYNGQDFYKLCDRIREATMDITYTHLRDNAIIAVVEGW